MGSCDVVMLYLPIVIDGLDWGKGKSEGERKINNRKEKKIWREGKNEKLRDFVLPSTCSSLAGTRKRRQKTIKKKKKKNSF